MPAYPAKHCNPLELEGRLTFACTDDSASKDIFESEVEEYTVQKHNGNFGRAYTYQ